MEKTWRWFGPKDKITLEMLRQIGVEGIVTALHHIPNGEVWTLDEVNRMKHIIESAGLRWSVVESLPVSESIKYAGPDRTDPEYPNADGTSNLYFNRAEFAYFDCHILGRKDARCDYDAATLERMDALAEGMDEEGRRRLVDTIIVKTQGFVNGNISEDDLKPVEKFRELLALYDGITRDDLRANMKYFLEAIMPVCRKWDINMCVHPDDPPLQILGLPRIVTCDEDIEWFLNAVPDPHNGLTFCAGSLSAGAHNDVPALARKYASRTHFVHARICNVLPNGDFKESTHLDPRLIDVVRTFERVNPALPMRVDHAPLMLGDHKMGYNAGYSFHGRMLALGMVSGIMAAVNTEK